jgi:hypothetical protein
MFKPLGWMLATLCATGTASSPASEGTAPGGCEVDQAHLVILPPGEQVTWREGLHTSEYPLSQSDIERAECLLIDQVEAWNKDMAEVKGGEHIEPSEYFRQYCVMRDSEGHRIVFLNAICARGAADAPWQRSWIEVEDGGACYFQALFDLTVGRVLEFNVNGEA